MVYTALKATHMSCALVSFTLFFARGIWIFSNPQRMKPAWVRIVPHVVDSLLLLSAIGLVMVTHQYPGDLVWLNVKIACLLLYIGFGMAAFRFLKDRRWRLTAWVMALATFIYIVLVAVKRTPFIL